MKEKLLSLLKKYRSQILYLFFGGVTTLVNLISYTLLYQVLGLPNLAATAVAWVLGVGVAFITNKLWVFDSPSFAPRVLRREITAFLGARVLTGLLDMGIMYLAVDVFGLHATLWKLISNVVVIILNYAASKLIIFKK